MFDGVVDATDDVVVECIAGTAETTRERRENPAASLV